MVVDQHQRLLLDMDQHVGLAIAGRIPKGERDWRQIHTIPEQRGDLVDFHGAGVSSWNFDHLDVAVQVERDEVAWVLR